MLNSNECLHFMAYFLLGTNGIATRHIPFSKRVKTNAFYSQKQLTHAQKLIKSNIIKRTMCIF